VSGSSLHEPPDEATVAAYLSDRLDASRAEAFEAYCLRHPEFARRVELDLFLKVGFKQMQAPSRDQGTGRRRRPMLAIAACITLVVGCGLLFLRSVHPGAPLAYRSETEVPAPLLSGPRVSVTLIRLRGDSAAHRIVAPRRAGVLAVRVVPDSPPGRLGYTMDVALESAVIPRSVTLDNLQPDADGYIQMYLPLAALAGQTLRIALNPSPAKGTPSPSFRLQVTYAESGPADSR
jgi:hypothetical protein